jgi:hypothetical protein
MTGRHPRRVARDLLLALFVPLFQACGGGGAALSFDVTTVEPAFSSGLGGGESVTIGGSGFLGVTIVGVTFGGSAATGMTVVSGSALQVTTPAAPNGRAGFVDVVVSSAEAGSRTLSGAYEYRAPPTSGTIAPDLFTPTGAEDFVIDAAAMGLVPNSTVQVEFEGVGTVGATVSADGSTIAGRAPVAIGAPPTTPRTVRVVPPVGAPAALANTVRFDWAAPLFLPVPFQAAGGASRPVRLDDTHALLVFAGANGAWGDADDEVALVSGLPGSPTFAVLRRPGNVPVGFLDPQNSIPAVLDADTAVLYSVGADGVPLTGDEVAVYLDGIGSSLTITNLAAPFPNTVPLAAVSSDTFAFGSANPPLMGGDGLVGTADDLLFVIKVTGGTTTGGVVSVGPLDPGGPASRSFPQTADGAQLFLVNAGANGIPGDGDDVLVYVSPLPPSPAPPSFAPARTLARRPIVLSPTLAAAPGGGPNGLLGDGDDVLDVWSSPAGAITHGARSLGVGVTALGLPEPAVRLGPTGVVIACVGPNGTAGDLDDQLVRFADAVAGSPSVSTIPGRPALSSLGPMGAFAASPGPNLVAGGGDDSAHHLAHDGGLAPFSAAPAWSQAFSPRTDGSRGFAVGPGADLAYGTGDETLLVFVPRAIAAAVSVSILPLALQPAAPAAGAEPFVPIGPSWGMAQSPGPDGLFGTADDALLLARY